MSRIITMTLGLVLILFGAQLYFVKSYLLTPQATRFLAEHFGDNGQTYTTPGPQNAGLQTATVPNSGNRGIFSNGSYQRPQGGGLFGNAGNGQAQTSPFMKTATSNYPGQGWPYYRANYSNTNQNRQPNQQGIFGGNQQGFPQNTYRPNYTNGSYNAQSNRVQNNFVPNNSASNYTLNGYGSSNGYGVPTQFASAVNSGAGGYFGQRRFAPPTWLCWPAFFLGVVFFLHGAALRRS